MLTKLKLIGLGSFEKWVYPAEQESSIDGDLLPLDAHMFPLLQVLIIRKCPKLLGLPFSNHITSTDWFPKLQVLELRDCPEFLPVIPISWIGSLHSVMMKCVEMLNAFEYSKSFDRAVLEILAEDDLHTLDQVLVFDKEIGLEHLVLERCPPLELKHLLMLTSLKILFVQHSDCWFGPLGGQADVEWQLPVAHMRIWDLNGNSGEELTELLPHLPNLSKLKIIECKSIKQLVVGLNVQQTTSEAAAEEEDGGMLAFPADLCDSLQELEFFGCPELVLVDPPMLQALRSLQRLCIMNTPKFISTFLFTRHIFPSSLQFLQLWGVEGLETGAPLKPLFPYWIRCREDLKCQGLQFLLTTGGKLNELTVLGSRRFFDGWDPNPICALEDAEGGEEQQTWLVSSTLQKLCTDHVEGGLLAAPICGILSSSLTELKLWSQGVGERFSKEEEDALLLLSSIQQLEFQRCNFLQQLPAGLSNLTSLKRLSIYACQAVSSLPINGFPKSLQELDVRFSNKELIQQCRGLAIHCAAQCLGSSPVHSFSLVELFLFHTNTSATCMT
ncbi:unnamed protein product [Triticum turgidum subsp. durum]|uniref:Uncharacterized protein n=1 Tax=Triticum turgidum subsp. durum TaxID=4567 RepID=A0A9R1RGQ6_TRITD|nr:unnamed protein product [Triticum turgidum subsp. durum]